MLITLKLRLNNLKSTEKLAFACWESLSFPKLILLSGSLGSGKTQFVKLFALLAGVKDLVTSSSFQIMNRFPLPKGGFLAHFDGFRINDSQAAGLIEYLDDSIILIEWPKPFLPLLKGEKYLKIEFIFLDKESREAIIEGEKDIIERIERIFKINEK